MESGLYITSFAATIFIAALVTVGVLFVALLTTLAVMLQSCQNRNDGYIEVPKTSDKYSYCRIFALHAELNGLKINDFPTICKAYAFQYIKEGQYFRDLNSTMWVAKSYFNSLTPQGDGFDVVLLDIDDILPSNHPYRASPSQYRLELYEGNNQVLEAHLQASILILELYSKLQASGWSLVLMTRKPEKQRNVTIKSLISSGYGGWSSLIMRSDPETLRESWEYFSRQRAELQTLGFRITSTISSQMDALTGPCLGNRIFKLPNPLTCEVMHHKSL